MSFGRGQGDDRRARAQQLLERVGLGDRLTNRPHQLSGGEQQRVAIAVALANGPDVLFADERTGERDTTTSAEIFDVLRDVNRVEDVTVVVVTHDRLVSEHVARTVSIRDGRTSSEVLRRATGVGGEGQVVAEEYAVLDRAGRLQLPSEYVDALGLGDRVRLQLEADHIAVWPDTPHDTGDDR